MIPVPLPQHHPQTRQANHRQGQRQCQQIALIEFHPEQILFLFLLSEIIFHDQLLHSLLLVC